MIVGMPTTSYPRSDADVAGDFVRGLARALVERGHRVEVVAPEPATPTRPLRDPGIAIAYVPYLRPRAMERTFYGDGVPDNIRRDPLALAGLATFPPALSLALARRARRWDAIVSHWALPSAVASGLVRGAKPHLAICHSADVHLLAALPGRRGIARAVEASATSLWFVAPSLRDRFEQSLGRVASIPVDIGPMGFTPLAADASDRETHRRALGLERFTVLSLSRLVGIKAIDRIIDAVASIPDATLLVAGEGPEDARLRARASERGVDARFLGTVRGEEKARVLRASDAFVLASRTVDHDRSEGAPVSLLEAMDAGLPIVAVDTGGVAPTLGDAGLLVREDVAAIAEALTRIRTSPELRTELRDRGLRRARAHSWEATSSRIEARLRRS